ncbi:hypothetical protein CHS0354_013429 [Potamilus streckersoni]|uniref:Uncharacterized protein n=1 Tax=Potamilus streckersoni TaxID=2493646 RepID=A0AAE0RV24_9BIVA|nr:hypothetical protein CHS0354_013429 [Potamilus streckersoni]
MIRWLKDLKRSRHGDAKDGTVEDDYGFRKKVGVGKKGQVASLDDDVEHSHLVCKIRDRLPTPEPHRIESSFNIYDEIRDISDIQTLPVCNEEKNEIDNKQSYDLRNAIEVGPYLIVPIVGQSFGSKDIEIFKKETSANVDDNKNDSFQTDCECNIGTAGRSYNFPWDLRRGFHTAPVDIIKDAKFVVTRCVKPRNNSITIERDRLDQMCSCTSGLKCQSQSSVQGPSKVDQINHLTSSKEDLCSFTDSREISQPVTEPNENETYSEYDISTSGESESSGSKSYMSTSADSDTSGSNNDYDFYLSKIRQNLAFKCNVQKIIESLESGESTNETSLSDADSMTYVSSLSEYSSAPSHVSGEVSDPGASADRSESDDSSNGCYDCTDNSAKSCDPKSNQSQCSTKNDSSNQSKLTGSSSSFKPKESKKSKDICKSHHRHKKVRSKKVSLDCRVYTTAIDSDKEMYTFPVDRKTHSDTDLKSVRAKSAIASQPTSVYVDHRAKSKSHNRLLGDLIRMNYDRQLLV